MKIKAMLVALAFAALLPAAAAAQTYVHGYTKKNGTYVAPHYRSSPNSTKLDNYSTRGNVNPYTGQAGTHDPYAQSASHYSQQSSYAQPARQTYQRSATKQPNTTSAYSKANQNVSSYGNTSGGW